MQKLCGFSSFASWSHSCLVLIHIWKNPIKWHAISLSKACGVSSSNYTNSKHIPNWMWCMFIYHYCMCINTASTAIDSSCNLIYDNQKRFSSFYWDSLLIFSSLPLRQIIRYVFDEFLSLGINPGRHHGVEKNSKTESNFIRYFPDAYIMLYFRFRSVILATYLFK